MSFPFNDSKDSSLILNTSLHVSLSHFTYKCNLFDLPQAKKSENTQKNCNEKWFKSGNDMKIKYACQK